MCKFVRVTDADTYLLSIRLRNSRILLIFAAGQLVVTAVALAQHIYSVVRFGKIFSCSFNETLSIARNDQFDSFLSYDVIVFDFGLFHSLIHVQECIANYLDGGYMRCLWCCGQLLALLALLLLLAFNSLTSTSSSQSVYHPLLLWPILICQNAYCFGLMILTIATADKLLVSLLHPLNGHLYMLIAIYFIGTMCNHLFCFVLWHYYWHHETIYKQHTGHDVIPCWV